MNTKLRTCIFVFVALFFASNGLAQKVPVSMVADASVNDDQTTLRFSQSLADEIQLSGNFYMWPGKVLPQNGVRITVKSIRITLKNGNELGSAIFIEAECPSGKDPGYFRVVSAQLMMIPKDASVADETRSFLASVDRELKR
jgi:hypothetical protein